MKSCPVFEQISWEQFGGKVLVDAWIAVVQPYNTELNRINAGQICDVLTNHGVTLGRRLFQPQGRLYDPFSLQKWIANLFAMALAVALWRAGWELVWDGPGAPRIIIKDGFYIRPFEIYQRIATGTPLDAEQWMKACLDAGIAT